MRFGFSAFCFRPEQKRDDDAEEHGCTDTGCGCREAAGECAEDAKLRNGLFNALGERAAEAGKRNGRAGSCPFDERRVKPDRLEYKSGDNVDGQYPRRGELCFVDKDLTDGAQRAANGENLDIFLWQARGICRGCCFPAVCL